MTLRKPKRQMGMASYLGIHVVICLYKMDRSPLELLGASHYKTNLG